MCANLMAILSKLTLVIKLCVLKSLILQDARVLEQDITAKIQGHVGRLDIGVAEVGKYRIGLHLWHINYPQISY
jgi:hypothetical protein